MPNFLLELRSEEIPARMQAAARDSLEKLFEAELAKADQFTGEVITYSTPRRLVLIAKDLPDATDGMDLEIKGPRTSAPPQSLDGFLRKNGLAREQLTEQNGVYFATISKPGRPMIEVLAEAIPAIVRAFPWPKSMRWGADSASTESLRWVRPLQGIVALFGSEVVPVEIAGIASGATTLGHRFHHPAAITIGSAEDYLEKLHACHVIVDHEERARIIRDGAAALAREAGLELVEDEGLVAENAGLTEWPVPLLGRFDEAFLDVPPEVIQLTARVNQKYFVCTPPRNGEGDHAQHGGGAGEAIAAPPAIRLANAFVCTANIAARDDGARIVEGNRKVLAARLSDARFFYETDLRVKLEDQAEKLGKIVFHEKLGTVADKVDRVAKLARWLVESGVVNPSPLVGEGRGPSRSDGKGEGPAAIGENSLPPHPSAASGGSLPLPQGEREKLADMAERAARLAKADLVTGMVGEFPELQGLMGGYYAAAQGEPPEVAAAIRDHYKPVGQGDEVPTAPVTVAVSLADKLDSIVQFFSHGIKPSGSKDPFALRRSAISVIELVVRNNLRVGLRRWIARQGGGSMALAIIDGVTHQGDPVTAAIYAYVNRGWSFSQARDSISAISETSVQGWCAIGLEFLEWIHDVETFFADRLKVQQREAGVRHDLIDAVFALGGEDDLVRLLARVRALQSFVGTEDGANLLAGYKRAANILKKEGVAVSRAPAYAGAQGGSAPDDSGLLRTQEHGGGALEPAEAALLAALDAAEPAAAAAVAQEDFEAAMAALATLRAPIDAFFEQVTVNDADPAKRARRLALLARVRDAVHTVADFSCIEG